MTRRTVPQPQRAPADWEKHAQCKGMDTDIFFPDDAGWTGAEQAKRAKAICHGCPVEQDCLAFALPDRRLAGVWGGMTEQERREEHRRRRRRVSHQAAGPRTALQSCAGQHEEGRS